MKFFRRKRLVSLLATVPLISSCFFRNQDAKPKPIDPLTIEELVCATVPEGTTVAPRYYREEDIERVRELVSGQDAKKIKEKISTVSDASIYCSEILPRLRRDGGCVDRIKLYGREDYLPSFEEINRNGSFRCTEGTLAAAAILEDEGFPPYFLIMVGHPGKVDHAVFLYKIRKLGSETGYGFGSIGINGADVNPPVFSSVNSLVEQIGRELGTKFEYSYIINIRDSLPRAIEEPTAPSYINIRLNKEMQAKVSL